jgi:integrase
MSTLVREGYAVLYSSYMARFNLTDRFVHHAKPTAGRTEFFDNSTRGLALRIAATGAKSWCFHYTSAGLRKRLTLGTYPATSLAQARTLAFDARALIEEGKDPTPIQADTLQAVCEEYLEREGQRLRTGQERRETFERLVYPALGPMQIDAIRRVDIVRLLDKIEDENGPVMADKTLAFLSRLFSWHASRTEFRSPIVRGMARTKPKERQRERVLTDDELRAIWRNATGPFGAMVRFILLTSARRSEASEMTWAEIDGADWTLPAARNKAKTDLVRPLSAAALAVLPPKIGDFVFTTDGATSISGYSKFKATLDRASGVTGWTLHDLRRTARSLMSRAGVNTDIAERCLGHVIGGVRGVYDRHEYYDEKAKAFEALAAQVERIVNPPEGNVVPLRGQP